MLLSPLARALTLLALTPLALLCGTVNLGVLSFDVLVPSSTTPGVNTFNFSNLTGNPASGGFALPPDFPVLTPVTFLSSTLTVVANGSPQVITLGNLGPGSLDATSAVPFPSNVLLSSAVFHGTLSQINLAVSGGSTLTAASLNVTATLLPTSGSSLLAGTDFAVITVSDVPEPATAVLTVMALAVLILPNRAKRQLRR